jgi:hypothetical protein
MMNPIIKEIQRALRQVVIFAPTFNREIIERARDLDDEQLSKLSRVLGEIIEYEKQEIARQLKTDPDFLKNIKTKTAARRALQLGREISFQESIDREKIIKLTNKIKQIL